MPTLLGADLIVQSLAREHISHVFTLPGGQMNPIHFAVDEEPGMNLIIPRQEGAGALMAAGFALASGRPTCLMTTVGAGIAYEIGALYFAWKERLPLLSIAPQVQSDKMKPIQENLQACDQDELFRPLTKFNAICYHRDRIPNLVQRALKNALAPEPGPVHLDVPVDVIFGFKRVSRTKMKKLFPEKTFRFQGQLMPNPQGLAAAGQMMTGASRPLVLAGRNVNQAGAGPALMNFLKQTGFPVMTSTAAFGAADTAYHLNLGTVRNWSEDDLKTLLAGADLLLLIEADEETARLAGHLKAHNPDLKVLQTAEMTSAIGSVVPLEAGLIGSPAAVADGLSSHLSTAAAPPAPAENWQADLKAAAATQAKTLEKTKGPARDRLFSIIHTIERINNALRPEDVVICEGPAAVSAASVHLRHPGLHNCILLNDDDMTGAGFPLSLGIKLARPSARVYLISQTEPFKRHHREFQTQQRYRLPTTTLLFQSAEKRPETEVDFTRLSQSLGVPARSIDDAEEEITDSLLKDAAASETGYLLDASGI